MLNPEEIAKNDQQLAALVEMLPTVIWRLFEGFKQQGFTEHQALHLVSSYLQGLAKH